MKLDKFDYLIILVMILCATIGWSYYSTQVIDECVSNPFVFGSSQALDNYEANSVYGTVHINKEGTESLVLIFNDTSIKKLN